MKGDAMGGHTMKKDAMKPATLSLSSESVNLGKHVGRKVSITGSPAQKMDAMGEGAMAKDTTGKATTGKETMASEPLSFTVKSMKVVATSCS